LNPSLDSPRVIFLAGGQASRWNNYLGVPKHLAPVPLDGSNTVPLLVRSIYQLHDRDITDIHVICDTSDSRYDVVDQYGVIRHERDNSILGLPGWLRTIPLWNGSGRTLILHGDWWFSETVMSLIVGATDPWVYGSRVGPSGITGVPYGEGAGVSFLPQTHSEYESTLRHVDSLGRNKILERTGSWEAWAAMAGVPDSELTTILDSPHHLTRRLNIPDDGSGDFDYPRDYDAWHKAYHDHRIPRPYLRSIHR
jgi:hypothetical protein